MSGKSKFVVLIFPIILVFAMVVSFYFNSRALNSLHTGGNENDQVALEEEGERIEQRGQQKARKIASKDLSNNLIFAFKKINEQNNEAVHDNDTGDFSPEEYQEANQNIDRVKNLYFFSKEPQNSINFQNENNRIQEHVIANQELYNNVLSLKIQDALLDDNEQAIKELFAVAASLPLGQSPVQLMAEQILVDMTTSDRGWNEEIFRNAMQFYYIQSLIKSEKEDPLLVNLVEKCSDEKLKQRIILINKEINIYSKNNEDQNESHQ